MIKNVIFDIGDVLVDFRWPDMLRDYNVPEEDIYLIAKRWLSTPIWDELDLGLVPEAEAIEHARAALGDKAHYVDLFMAHLDELIIPKDYAVPLMKEIKSRGFGVYLLSNYPDRMFNVHAKQFGFLGIEDGSVISYRVGAIKPDPRIYQTLLDDYALEPGECIFFDDREKNVLGARAVGIRAEAFTGEEQVRKTLRELGILE